MGNLAMGSTPPVLFVFLAVLVVSHIFIVYWRPLGKIGLKKLDYWWLAVGVLGLVPSAQ